MAEPAEHLDLPARWRAAIAYCPYCSGTGRENRMDERSLIRSVDCARCEGSGDLMAALLLDAYRRGRGHVLEGLQSVDEVRKLAIERMFSEQPTGPELKRAMGLGLSMASGPRSYPDAITSPLDPPSVVTGTDINEPI